MTEENKLKKFLKDGFQVLGRPEEEQEEEEYIEEEAEDGEALIDEAVEEEEPQGASGDEVTMSAIKDLETELLRIRYLLEDMKAAEPPQAPPMPDMSAYMTTREQFKSVTASIEKRNGETADKVLVRAMEAISVMREDFFKLCNDMRAKLPTMSPETVLSSFEAYTVDMENILSDAGVQIGAFPYEKLNTLHQRIVGVVPTGEIEKDGKVAARLTDGYKMGDRVLLKEKVDVYKFDPKLAPAETASETVSETADDVAAKGKEESIQEEEE